ncbi:pyridoxamine 5'-phosphate oxidase [Gramella sp. AN32]|uniref:Pyridoxine/pyridoxamine 5'-phosphate oxidase n=1 Tax=Christiangramia antarctica TaxID=2058158 RepID=A0ABW5X6A4_9FLAO|nr:pyridoxamine 5'-phosphate oxidase [Gramella sp. AN32]MCM4156024.1 pyridoxamine 5'-phosphate oxidase [Gramella sp. AN32]
MKNNISGYRKSYEKGTLSKKNIPENPLDLFKTWFQLADENHAIEEVNAMSLSTVGNDLLPKTRVVLLKSFDENGFVFYSNYTSQKGQDLKENPQCCISFFWPVLEKQIIIKGKVEKISRDESEKYFHSRPRGSQLGALVSNQSAVIDSREYLESKLQDYENEYKNKEIPMPNDWGGYVVSPISFEFWQGRENRLHDRLRFSKAEKNWIVERLAP